MLTAYQRQALMALLAQWQSERRLGTPRMAPGPTDSLTDVPGVRVGHHTVAQAELQTGVTAIVPPGGNLFATPLPCGAAVLNGFAKPVGWVQLVELGRLETPILLSNTLAVGTLFTTLVREAITTNSELGRSLPTVNPVALECNDGWLNDIQALAVTEEMAREALQCADTFVARGSIGAGRGMSCFGLKGGIGTASRRLPELHATLGVLVLANFGTLSSLTIAGAPLGAALAETLPALAPQRDAGSIIIIMATDAPLEARQLTRIAKRAGAGLGRLGSHWGHGSGDIALAFSTQPTPVPPADAMLEEAFCAAADATEHAVVDALLQAQTVTGFREHQRQALPALLDQLSCRF